MSNFLISDSRCLIEAGGVIERNIDGETPLTTVVPTLPEGTTIYALGTCSSAVYPVSILETDTEKAAVVTVSKIDNVKANVTSIASVQFEYDGTVWACQFKNSAAVGAAVTAWAKLTNE